MTPSKHQFDGHRVRIPDVFDLQMGKTPSRKNPLYWRDGNHDWVSIADLGSFGKYVGKTKERINDFAVKESGIKLTPANTVLMSFKLSLGKTSITTEPVYTNEAIMAFINKGLYPVDTSFMYHQCRSKDWAAGTNAAVMGKTLNKRTLGRSVIFLPSLEEQEDIAAKLDFIDEQLQKAKDVLHELDSLVKSRFVEMFGNDKLFQARQMGQLFSGIVSGTNVSGKQRSILPGEFAVLKISAVTKGFFKPNEYKVVDDVSNIKMIHPRKGDLLFSRANTSEMVGATAIVDDDYEQLFLPDKLWRLDPAEGVNSLFLKYLLSTERVRAEISKASTGTSGSMQNISMAKFSRIDVFLPSAELQQQFADFAAQVDKSRFAGTFTGTINVKNYAISCSVHNNSGRIPNEALHSVREVTECALFELQELYDSLTQKYFAL
ncbi:restriction endonuclease subunit S [Bifidobacterium merycicum]|uniref:Restriction modification system DNA specificity subunit n=1 Tax=Bifidobacterium merycicum TaxID=78345 RepID=A0A087BH20_9BIFI|nr:restriction endonuclease subunit S [Bifidobacterium merycicum]KFI70320.1 restriction modification system DNA specificity subunit [Bifidobacterium merycicum]SHE52373.1 type I restriction enzyme, S subunit [Bifidobacterium merycicum DSM 6492]